MNTAFNDNNVYNVIANMIADSRSIDKASIDKNKYLFLDYGFDSLSFIEFVVMLETEFDMEFEELVSDASDITVDNLTKYIESKG